MGFKSNIKKLIPKKLLNLRHLYYAWKGAVKYGHPSEEIFVIGITGTSGKSSTTYFLRQILEGAGLKVGSLSTIDFYIAGEDKLNDQKMTMLGKMQIQKYLREMVDKKCDVAIVETTSEGAVQYRHKFINYDVMCLTNLYPEHIESHGSFENYKGAKLSIFEYVSKSKRKKIEEIRKLPARNVSASISGGETKNSGNSVPKVAVVNGDIEYANEFLQYPFDNKLTFGKDDSKLNYAANNIEVNSSGLHFEVNNTKYNAPLFGEHNVLNITLCIAIAESMGILPEKIQAAVSKLKGPPGRLEFIKEAEQKGFQVIVDYAFEPVAMEKLYEVVKLINPTRVIHVFGSTGGGRDVSRRFTVGELVANNADICIVTDEDPYDDEPVSIINDVASAVEKAGKVEGKNLFKILNRNDAIQKAVELAQEGDLILVTGKGSEQGMVVKGKIVPWDDRAVVREVLRKKT